MVASSEDKWYQQVAGADAVYDDKGAFQSGTIANPSYGGSPFNSSRRINQRTSGTRDLALQLERRAPRDVLDLLHPLAEPEAVGSTGGEGDDVLARTADLAPDDVGVRVRAEVAGGTRRLERDRAIGVLSLIHI